MHYVIQNVSSIILTWQ